MDPILSHGSTLGLYEVLIGKPYICDMITDSVVHCFFIETEKIEQLCQSDPSVEAFLWQESALVAARLLLPQIFEKMEMGEIRILIAERSTMNIYIKGEDIGLEQNCVGILLEGFLKTKNQNLIAPPGVLLPSNTDLNLFGLQSSAMNHIDYCYTAPSYQVEARARVIFLEIGRPETEADLPQTLEAQRTLSKEHSGLLSWPESFRKSRGPQSVSMINDMYSTQSQRRQRLHRMQANQKHSSSYPGVPSRPSNARTLPCVKSEGSNMVNGRVAPAPPVPVTAAAAGRRRRRKAMEEDDNSSDESAGEEEVIIRVDSPSMLSFCQSSGAVDSPQAQGKW